MLLLTLGAILVLSPLMRNVCRRMSIPVSVGYITLGLVLSVIGREWITFPRDVQKIFGVLAQLGIVALLFRVGLKSHTRALLRKLPQASLIWLGDVVVSLAIGYFAARYLLQLSFETSLVLAIALSATSVAVSISAWEDAGKLKTAGGQLLVDVAELDDLSGVILLAVALGVIPIVLNGGEILWFHVGTTTLLILVKVMIFISGCYLFSHLLEPGFTRFIKRASDSNTGLTLAILGVGLVIAAIADTLGFSLAIGALFAGLAFSRDPEAVRTDGKFSYFDDFLTPFFFINIGFQTDIPEMLASIDSGLWLFAAAVLAKFAGVATPALLTMGHREATILGISMIPRAEITLVVVYQARQVSEAIVPAEVFASVVLVSLLSSVLAPIALSRMLSKA